MSTENKVPEKRTTETEVLTPDQQLDQQSKQEVQTVTYKDLLKNKGYAKLLIATLISRFGDSIDSIAYGFMVYNLTGSSALMAALFAVNSLPNIVFSIFAGGLVSYLPKKLVVFLADLLRGLTVALTAVLFITGKLEVWHLFVFTILNSSFETFRAPASSTMTQGLLSKEYYTHATSLSGSLITVAEIIGFAAAGAIIGIFSIGGAIIFDAATFLFCGLIIMTIKYKKDAKLKKPETVKTYFRDLGEGLAVFKQNHLILYICIFGALIGFFLTPFNSLQAPYVIDVLAQGPSGMTVLAISFLVAMSLSSILAPTIMKKIKPKGMFVMGGVGLGLAYGGLSFMGQISDPSLRMIAVGAVCFFMGFSAPIMNIPISVSFMKTVKPEYMSRVSSVFRALAMTATPLGAAITAGLVTRISIPTLFLGCGAILVLLFLLQSFNKTLRGLND